MISFSSGGVVKDFIKIDVFGLVATLTIDRQEAFSALAPQVTGE